MVLSLYQLFGVVLLDQEITLRRRLRHQQDQLAALQFHNTPILFRSTPVVALGTLLGILS